MTFLDSRPAPMSQAIANGHRFQPYLGQRRHHYPPRSFEWQEDIDDEPFLMIDPTDPTLLLQTSENDDEQQQQQQQQYSRVTTTPKYTRTIYDNQFTTTTTTTTTATSKTDESMIPGSVEWSSPVEAYKRLKNANVDWFLVAFCLVLFVSFVIVISLTACCIYQCKLAGSAPPYKTHSSSLSTPRPYTP